MSDDAAAFPIDELVRRVVRALERVGVRQTNGQVSEAPTERTLRYYRTRGLLDAPAGHRGRTALYGPRHVLQVLAIKRLQASDVPLHEIQQRLVGRTDADLAAIAGVEASQVNQLTAVTRRQDFWADRPAAPAFGGAHDPPAHRIAGLQLAAGVRLTFPASRDLTMADQAALSAAAELLIACLRERDLVPDPQHDSPPSEVVERTTP